MARFMIRVELHNATWADYDKLHKCLKIKGVDDIIVDESTGKRYRLPPAEYYTEQNVTRNAVLEAVKVCAASTGRNYAAVVTETVATTWYGLSPA